MKTPDKLSLAKYVLLYEREIRDHRATRRRLAEANGIVREYREKQSEIDGEVEEARGRVRNADGKGAEILARHKKALDQADSVGALIQQAYDQMSTTRSQNGLAAAALLEEAVNALAALERTLNNEHRLGIFDSTPRDTPGRNENHP